ncbi:MULTISPECIES: flagellin N-terminal helical domain-containing protein [Bacillus]|uniref:Flagellin n=3 Tax=Bacillus thuringiensis TaxID=1428 RepID=A0A1W6WKD2_BACTU|nr:MULTISPECIES: flagellin [Bacillus]MEC2876378.1 flagellin [Bacillus cereus]AEA15269.1 flagellin [Bacillus thuringiensis serovar chinensis CT-43]AFV17395.1 flagellin B [Bacillus thuringiensis Bt407]AGG00320.1 Flagellin protein FlaA [Bacillus thuringiensis serovar thuringiensis str. IS5056]ARP57031.1 flagellin [Bacillus thuringiensis]
MRINTNINSMRTQEYMRQNQAKMSNAMDRLSSGKRINNASDDAAGLAIATRMRARESGLGVAANNTQDGMSLIRTADSAMNSVSNILLRMRDISNQSANGTNTDKNQSALDKEFAALKDQIDYISKNTEFNDQKLLDGSKKSIAIQTLDNADTNKQIDIQLSNVSTKELKLDTLSIEGSSSKTFTITADDMLAVGTANATAKAKAGTLKGLNVTTGDLTAAKTDVQDFRAAFDKVKGFMGSTEVTNIEKALTKFDGDQSLANAKAIGDALTSDLATTIAKDQTYSKNVSNASSAIASIDAALESIASNRATLGATLNRLDFNVNNLKSQSSSMASAASQIEDADMAKEMSEMTKFKILNEAGISMLSQANQTPQMVSKLLQ